MNFLRLIILALIGYSVYGAGVSINYYGDDFQWYFNQRPPSIRYYFSHKNPYENQAYRPLQASFMIVVQRFWGQSTLPIHLTQIALHVILCWLIWSWMVSDGFTTLQATLGSLFMLISQANAMAVLSVDTISQVFSTTFGCAGLWLLIHSFAVAGGSHHRQQRSTGASYFLLSLLAFALALLSKETGVAFFGMALCLIVFKNVEKKRSWLGQSMIQISPYLAILVFYLGVRLMLELRGPGLSSSRYGFHFGWNIIQNLFHFLFQAFLAVSSVDVFIAFKNGELLKLSMIIILWLVLFSSIFYGLIHTKGRRNLILLGAFALIGLFPVAFLNHVSELYLYNSMPFFSCLIGAAIGTLIQLSLQKPVLRTLLILSTLLLMMMNVVAIQRKLQLMKANGERAAQLLVRMTPYFDQISDDGQLLLLNPDSNTAEYSVFLMNGFNVLQNGRNRIRQLSGKSHLQFKILQMSEINLEKLPDNAVVLTLAATGNIVRIH